MAEWMDAPCPFASGWMSCLSLWMFAEGMPWWVIAIAALCAVLMLCDFRERD